MDRITDPDGAVGGSIGSSSAWTSRHRSEQEFSPGQFEINLMHDEVLGAADSAFLLKSGIKELAILEGMEQTSWPSR
ncbi:hypothetical protein [Amycolatopsis plumensis]|uniref:hypothetical protein n=1 Tax=Amycolatopsis plumensis TaxID=236508 RepID=UPI003609B78D